MQFFNSVMSSMGKCPDPQSIVDWFERRLFGPQKARKVLMEREELEQRRIEVLDDMLDAYLGMASGNDVREKAASFGVRK